MPRDAGGPRYNITEWGDPPYARLKCFFASFLSSFTCPGDLDGFLVQEHSSFNDNNGVSFSNSIR